MNIKISDKNEDLLSEISRKEINSVFSTNFKEINLLLKSTASPNRIKILNYLLQYPRNLNFFLDKLQIKRTTLIHHIKSLMDVKLIVRQEWGKYAITNLGIKFIEAIAGIYQINLLEIQKQNSQILNNYNLWPDFYRNTQSIDEKTISNSAFYQLGWNSFVSAASGVLQSLGSPFDYIYFSGRNGYCFITTPNHMICAQHLPKELWDEIYLGSESFGWDLKIWSEKRKEVCELRLNNEDYDTSLKIFHKIKKIIDDDNFPIVLLGIHGCGFAIINGYRGDSYLVSSYFHIEGKEEIPIKFNELKLIDYFTYFYFKKSTRVINEENEDKKSLIRAIKFANGEMISQNEYISGPLTYDTWIEVLQSDDNEINKTFGHSTLSNYYKDAKFTSSEYLHRLSFKYQTKSQSAYLGKASKCYNRAEKEFVQLLKIFPLKNPDFLIVNEDMKIKAIKILTHLKEIEIDAINFMKDAIIKWE